MPTQFNTYSYFIFLTSYTYPLVAFEGFIEYLDVCPLVNLADLCMFLFFFLQSNSENSISTRLSITQSGVIFSVLSEGDEPFS